MNLMRIYIPCVLVISYVRPFISVFVLDEQTRLRFERMQERKKWWRDGQAMNIIDSTYIHFVFPNLGG